MFKPTPKCTLAVAYKCLFIPPLLALLIIGKLKYNVIKHLFCTGSLYFNQCTLNNKIPLFLIVISSTALVLLPIRLLITCIYCKGNARNLLMVIFEAFILLLHLVGIVPFNFYTLEGWHTWNSNGRLSCSTPSPNCCDPVLMYFAYVMIYVIDGFCILLAGVMIIYYIYKYNYKEYELPHTI